MNATTVAVDLARSVFQLAVADASRKVIESHRLTGSRFERFFNDRDVDPVILEGCGCAHYRGRRPARAVLRASRTPDGLRARALDVHDRADHEAACALANELARIRLRKARRDAPMGNSGPVARAQYRAWPP